MIYLNESSLYRFYSDTPIETQNSYGTYLIFPWPRCILSRYSSLRPISDSFNIWTTFGLFAFLSHILLSLSSSLGVSITIGWVTSISFSWACSGGFSTQTKSSVNSLIWGIISCPVTGIPPWMILFPITGFITTGFSS